MKYSRKKINKIHVDQGLWGSSSLPQGRHRRIHKSVEHIWSLSELEFTQDDIAIVIFKRTEIIFLAVIHLRLRDSQFAGITYLIAELSISMILCTSSLMFLPVFNKSKDFEIQWHYLGSYKRVARISKSLSHIQVFLPGMPFVSLLLPCHVQIRPKCPL